MLIYLIILWLGIVKDTSVSSSKAQMYSPEVNIQIYE